jgi:hypothetical protein
LLFAGTFVPSHFGWLCSNPDGDVVRPPASVFPR